MRGKVLFVLFLIILYSTTVGAVTTQNFVQQIPPPPSNLFQEILYYIAQAYNWLIGIIQSVLQNTLLKQDPQLAVTYANIIAWLIPLTALYVLLTFIEVIRKYLGFLIVAGWLFLIIVMILAR